MKLAAAQANASPNWAGQVEVARRDVGGSMADSEKTPHRERAAVERKLPPVREAMPILVMKRLAVERLDDAVARAAQQKQELAQKVH